MNPEFILRARVGVGVGVGVGEGRAGTKSDALMSNGYTGDGWDMFFFAERSLSRMSRMS
jgi:hypothetical protein